MANHDIHISITATAASVVNAAKQARDSLQAVGNTKVRGNPFTALQSAARAFADRIQNANTAVRGLDSAFSKLKNTSVGVFAALRAALQAATESTKNDEKATQGLDSALSKLKGAVAGAFAVGSIVAFGKQALSAAANVEVFKKGLNFQIGEAQTETLISNIRAIGEASAYDTSQLLPMAKQWINIGENAEQATARMQTIVDCGSAFGLTTDAIQGANLALTQMQMAGKIGQQDMMQLLNAGIPAWQLLSDQMGIPVQQLKDMSSQGELTQDAMDALFQAMKDKTEGASQSLSDSLMGKFSNLEEIITNTMGGVGTIISKAFNIPGILDELGELAEGFSTHINNIQAAAEGADIGQAICNELEKINPTAGAVANTLLAGIQRVKNEFDYLKKIVNENKGAVDAFIDVAKNLVEAIAIIKGVELAWRGVRAAIMLAHVAQQAFAAFMKRTPWGFIATVLVAALLLIIEHWDQLKATAQAVWNAICSACINAAATIQQVIGGAIDRVKQMWNDLKAAVSHPLDFTVNILRHVTTAEAKGGINGGPMRLASGGLVGGHIPALANGGTLKHGTPAIVGEAGPEAVIPLKDMVLAKIGEGIANAYKKGQAAKSEVSDISFKIQSELDTGDMSAYAKALETAEQKAKAVGEHLQAFYAYQKQANDEAAKYAADGQATLDLQDKIAQTNSKIAELQEKINSGKGKSADQARLSHYQKELAEVQATYDKEKAAAIKAAQEANAARAGIEKQAADAEVQIRQQAENKIFAQATALEEAKRQLRAASNATELSEYQALMNAKDAITGKSYANELAEEQYLAQQRQAWHEQLMLNSVTWGTYMQTLLTNLGVSLEQNLSQGLASVITQGQSLYSTFWKIAQTIATQIVQGVLQKWIASMGILGGLNQSNSQKEIINAHRVAAAEASKTGVMAANAAAAVIAAMPWTAYGAGALVAGQMATASAAGKLVGTASAVHAATGGLITGSGTGKSDSIPAMLSDGEYVINADAVRRIGTPALHMINSGYTPRFADGGAVGRSVETAGAAMGPSMTLNISALDAGSFSRFLAEGGLDAIRQALFENSRNFGDAAGVF